MSMQVGGGGDEDAPMMDINTTPLIDVMLVLIIMLIITIPIQTHAVKMNMPVGPSSPHLYLSSLTPSLPSFLDFLPSFLSFLHGLLIYSSFLPFILR